MRRGREKARIGEPRHDIDSSAEQLKYRPGDFMWRDNVEDWAEFLLWASKHGRANLLEGDSIHCAIKGRRFMEDIDEDLVLSINQEDKKKPH